MARIRTIKPEFYQDEDLACVSESAFILAAGLLNQADDEGYFRAHPGLIKAGVFPLREPSVSIHDMLIELSNIGYIRLFDGSDGKKYGVITGFVKHQKVNRPTPSKIKELQEFNEDSVSAHGGLTIGKERKGKERNREQGRENARAHGSVKLISDDWQPSKIVCDRLELSGIPKKFIQDQITEFIDYWVIRGEAHDWDTKFYSRIQNQWINRGKSNGTGKPLSAVERVRRANGLSEFNLDDITDFSSDEIPKCGDP
jgi:DNA replication protein DnaT